MGPSLRVKKTQVGDQLNQKKPRPGAINRGVLWGSLLPGVERGGQCEGVETPSFQGGARQSQHKNAIKKDQNRAVRLNLGGGQKRRWLHSPEKVLKKKKK